MAIRRFHQIVILLILAALAGFTWGFEPNKPTVNFPKHPIKIITQTAKHELIIEVATSPAQLEHGLMFRKELADNTGMLFIFPKPQEIGMWMKNTYIPLDMLFIDEQGVIKTIAENAQPLSEDLIISNGKAKMVLEMNAGSAKKMGVHVNDKLIYETPAR